MGIFNMNIIKELEEGLKDFENTVKKNFGTVNEQPVSIKCKNCGATIETTTAQKSAKCSYCGSLIENDKYVESGTFKSNKNNQL